MEDAFLVFMAIAVVALASMIVAGGWKSGKKMDRSGYLLKFFQCAFYQFVLGIGINQAGGFWALGLFGLSLWVAWTWYKALGERLLDAGWSLKSAFIMGALALTGLPFMIAAFPRSKKDDVISPSPIPKSSPNPKAIMKHSAYEVRIPEGGLEKDGYIPMEHGRTYSIVLANGSPRRCDAEVVIDGKAVGAWRVNAASVIIIERPANDVGKFTFFRAGTPEAKKSELVDDENLGLISVTFIPETSEVRLNASSLSDYDGASGGTGLSGKSSQVFGSASPIQYDEQNAFTIHLRLVAAEPDIRPLMAKSTHIPPRVAGPIRTA